MLPQPDQEPDPIHSVMVRRWRVARVHCYLFLLTYGMVGYCGAVRGFERLRSVRACVRLVCLISAFGFCVEFAVHKYAPDYLPPSASALVGRARVIIRGVVHKPCV